MSCAAELAGAPSVPRRPRAPPRGDRARHGRHLVTRAGSWACSNSLASPRALTLAIPLLLAERSRRGGVGVKRKAY